MSDDPLKTGVCGDGRRELFGQRVPGWDEVEGSKSRGERSWTWDKVMRADATTNTIGRVVARASMKRTW